MKLSKNDLIDLKIEKLTYNGGRGLGRHFNFVVFVEGITAPQDQVRVRLTKVKKNYALAELVEIISQSSLRTEPPCKYFNDCGGCQWQHINYNEQVLQKNEFVKSALDKLNLQTPLEFIKSHETFHYRNRIQLNVQNGKVGYYKRNSHDLIDIDKCLIAKKEINAQINEFRTTQIKNGRYEFSVTTDNKAKVYPIKEKHQHNVFSQVNNSVNSMLIEKVLEQIENQNFTRIYDAYCGTGNFTIPVQQQFQKTPIVGIDYSKQNIQLAQTKNTNIEFVYDKVERYFQKNKADESSLVILDPPRSGCDASVLHNVQHAKKIAYISCDLATMTRDAGILLKLGFDVERVYGFDMFPQTYHTETLFVFSKI